MTEEDYELEEEEEEEEEGWGEKHKFLKIILSLFLIFMLLIWLIPVSKIKSDPSPDYDKIPSLKSLTGDLVIENFEKEEISSLEDFSLFIDSSNPIIKDIAVKIATSACKENKICYSKALYYFVRDKIKYINDPVKFEYVEKPTEVLISGGADCDGHAVLLASLERAIGINSRLVFVPGHVYVQIYLPEARAKYKAEEDMVYLDATCKTCQFGELPPLTEEPTSYGSF